MKEDADEYNNDEEAETSEQQDEYGGEVYYGGGDDDGEEDDDDDNEEDEDRNLDTERESQGEASKRSENIQQRVYGSEEDYTDEEADKSGTEVSPLDNPYFFRDACDKLDMGHLMQEDVRSNARDEPGFAKYADADDKLETWLNEIDQCEAKPNETLKPAQSYISDTCSKVGSEKKDYRCTKSTKGSAANIKSKILCQDEGSSSDSHDPFEILTKVEKVPVLRPHTPEIICLDDDPVIIKPSRFSAQPAKSSSGVCRSLQRSTASVHFTTVHDVDDETVDADVKEMAAAISQRALSSSEEMQDISHTSGVTIPHAVDVDDVQSSSENAKTPLLQLAQEISIAAYGSSASEQVSKDSGLKMHEASEARTWSLKTFEEVNPVQQYTEHSDILFASTVHTNRHTTGVGKHVKSSSQVDFNPGYGDDVGFNVIGGSDREQLKKSTVVKDDGGDAGVNPKKVTSDTKFAVQLDDSPIVVSSDSEDNASKKEKEDKTRKVTADTKQSEKPRFPMIEGNWLQSKLDSVDNVEALYSLGANFILDIELVGYPMVNIDAWDENIGKEVRLPTIDDIAERTCQHLWCTEVGIIDTAPEVVEFHEPRYSRGVSWPQSCEAIMYAVDPGPVMYANELVICEEDLPTFYVCSTTGGERTFAAIESKALPRKSLERVTLTTSTCKLNSQQTSNFINMNGRQYPKDGRICFVPDPMYGNY